MSETISFDIGRGDIVKHRFSSFQGTVVALTKWYNGCTRITVQSPKLEGGRPVEAQAFDVEELTVLKPAPRERIHVERGGPKPAPTRRSVSRGK